MRVFANLCRSGFRVVCQEMGTWEEKESFYRSFGLTSAAQLRSAIRRFEKELDRALAVGSATGSSVSRKTAGGIGAGGRSGSEAASFLMQSLRLAFVRGDVEGLTLELKYSFQTFLFRSQFPKLWNAENYTNSHRNIADCRYPWEWFPATRALQRTVHVHVGPTNSGKTYNALKALENAKSGMYAGPLRLLAQEIYARLQAKGMPCALLTGDHQVIPEDATRYYYSCTVEMVPTNMLVDVAIIDEIQLIADPSRGWAWTQAFLGIQARNLHVCGEERAVDLIQRLCAAIGDKCIVHRYERLSPLETMDKSLDGDFTKLEKGDAVVAFSRLGLHAMKRKIESTTGKRCAIIYGSLPPPTRSQQAALFNDPNNDYDFLVATDAIGMGLNLEIKRVIFETTIKRFRGHFTRIPPPEIKQIGGRAGRFRSAAQEMRESKASALDINVDPRQAGSDGSDNASRSVGLVTTLDKADLRDVQRAFESPVEQLKAACIRPTAAAIEQMSAYFPPNTPLSFILLRLRELARTSPLFFLGDISNMIVAADLIQEYPMHITDRCVFLVAPLADRDEVQRRVFRALAACVSSMSSGNLLDIAEMPLEVLDEDPDLDMDDVPASTATKTATSATGKASSKTTTTLARVNTARLTSLLARLESLHRCLTLYLWLSYRFSTVFTSRRLAQHAKELVERRIDEVLDRMGDRLVASYARAQAAAARSARTKKSREEEQLRKALLEQPSEEAQGGATADADFVGDLAVDADEPESDIAGEIADAERADGDAEGNEEDEALGDDGNAEAEHDKWESPESDGQKETERPSMVASVE